MFNLMLEFMDKYLLKHILNISHMLKVLIQYQWHLRT